MIRWVKQEEATGCAIACVAMVTGRSYRQVRRSFARALGADGVFDYAVEEYFTTRGYALQKRRPQSYLRARPWRPRPFAEVHLCIVEVPNYASAHMVVLLADGTVLDPLTPQPMRLADYTRVRYVAAVIPVPEVNGK